jgi:hypothetical protein
MRRIMSILTALALMALDNKWPPDRFPNLQRPVTV